MPKVTLNTIGSRYGSVDALNDNFDSVEAAIENTLSRDGTGPNAMDANLDMNGNTILNVSSLEVNSLTLNGQIVVPTNLAISTLPTQTGQSGKYLSTDGTAAFWQTPSSSQVTFVQSGVNAQSRTVQDKLRESVSVKDFGAVGNGIADDTLAIQAAINSLSSGGILRLLNRHAISSRINVTKPIYIEGVAQGNAFQPVQASVTELIWTGGVSAGAMIRFGLYGTGVVPLWGGGMSRVMINGSGTCAHGLEVADASYGTYRDITVRGTTASGLHLITDGTKANHPSAWNSFYKCFMDMRVDLAASANAHGILIEAVNGVNAGVTLNYFEDLKVNHSGGDGIRWIKGGDGFVFIKPQIFRADAETGYACNFSSTDLTDICNHAVFYYPIASGGMYFASPGLHLGTMIHGYDSQNINAGLVELVSGPGAAEVSGTTTFGQQLGISRLGSTRDLLIDDPMSLVLYDIPNNVCFTNAGAWKVASGGSAISASNEVGSGLRLTTLATVGDSVLLSHSNAANGTGTGLYPSMQFGIKIESTTAVKTRWGLFDSNADPAGDGLWVEFDPTLSSGQYRLVASRGGTQTVIVNPLGLTGTGNSPARWRIDVQPGRVTFHFASSGAPNPQLWTYLGTITTNVPITTTAMACGVYIKTTAAVAKSMVVGDIKLAQRTDYL